MAKEDAAEQVKEVVRQLIKHRFWIAVGFAALFAIIAYFMGAGPVQAKANSEKAKIVQAEKDVRAYSDKSKPISAVRADRRARRPTSSSKDVNNGLEGAVRTARPPLLTWPETRRGSDPQVGAPVAGERGSRQRHPGDRRLYHGV